MRKWDASSAFSRQGAKTKKIISYGNSIDHHHSLAIVALFMTDMFEIYYAVLNDVAWLRCEGKGNFLVSPRVKSCAEFVMANGCVTVIVDLEKCSGMDSTFMGMLAGVGAKLMKKNGKLIIVHSGEKNRASLADLGMDALMEIHEENEADHQIEEQMKELLKPYDDSSTKLPCRDHVIECHKTLSELNEENAEKFQNVVKHMKPTITP